MQPINLITVNFPISAEAADRIDQLNARCRDFNDGVNELAEGVEKVSKITDPIEIVGPSFTKSADRLTKLRMELLGREFMLRTDMLAFDAALDAEQNRAYEKAVEDNAAARQQIKAALIDLGYLDGTNPAHGQSMFRIVPEFYHRHPLCHAAFVEESRLRSRINSRQQEHSERLATLSLEIAGVQRKITTALSA